MVKFVFGKPIPAASPYEESYVLASMPRRTIEQEYYTRQENRDTCQKAYKRSYSPVSWAKMVLVIAFVSILVLVLSQSLEVVALVALLMVIAKLLHTRSLRRKADFAQERFEACPSLDQIKSRDDFRKSAPADISFEMGSIPRAKSNLDDFKLDDDSWADRTKPESSQPQVVLETDDDDTDDKLENLSKMIRELEDLIRQK